MPTYRLRKKCRIFKQSRATSDGHFVEKQPQKVAAVWAEIKPLTATERVQAMQIYAGATHRILIRWPEVNIEAKMYVETLDGQQYPILGITDMAGEGRFVELICGAPQYAIGTETMR